jgi:hypothetical protein
VQFQRTQLASRPAKRPRENKPVVGDRALEAMRADIESGKFTVAQLSEMGRAALAETYLVSGSTAYRALSKILAG